MTETAAFEGGCARLARTGGELSDAFEVGMQCLAPAAGEVVVKVLAAGVNMSDVKEARGLMPFVEPPVVTGRDFSGVVVHGPEELMGKAVYGTGGELGFRRDGSHAQYLCVPAECVALKPSKLTHEEAGTLGVPYVTAYEAVVTKAQVATGELVVVQGASGMVGRAALQLAKQRGATTVALVRREGLDLAAADVVLNLRDYDTDVVVGAIIERSGRRGCDVFLDLVGGENTSLGIRALGESGRLVVVSSPSPEDTASFNVFEFYRKQLSIFGINTLALSDQRCAEILATLAPAFESGELQPFLVNKTRYALGELHLALNTVSKGLRYRVAILPWGSADA